MNIEIEKNKLCNERQSIEIEDSVITLIGENGCGKSSILEAVFEESLHNDGDKTIVCFSSGQNESFSNFYFPFIHNARNLSQIKEGKTFLALDKIKTFYFDYDWSKFLIFFASNLKKEGLTRSVLMDKYIDTNTLNEDISSELSFDIEIGDVYKNRIQESLKQEENDALIPTLRKTTFHSQLSKLVEFKIDSDYDFNSSLKKTEIKLNYEDISRFYKKDSLSIFQFLSIATNNSYFINTKNSELKFKNGLNLNMLSDGEYQLSVIYSIIDLFDTTETLFLFDEIDSHLHYHNIEVIWKELYAIKGKIITTSHISDSLVQNRYESLRIVEKGKIIQNGIANDLVNRIKNLSNSSEYYFKVASKIPYIVLVEDESDWIIFKELARIKIGSDYSNSKFESIQVIKCSSGYSSLSERFGNSKIDWVDKFLKVNSTFSTKAIFMICDRDEFTLNDFHSTNGVEIIGTHRYNKKFNNQKSSANLLSWKRKQIENYLLSYTMLTKHNKLSDINNEFGDLYKITENNPMDIQQIQIQEIKAKIQSLYVNAGHIITPNNPEGIDFERLLEVIKDIPATEISGDIQKMYNFIVSKIN